MARQLCLHLVLNVNKFSSFNSRSTLFVTNVVFTFIVKVIHLSYSIDYSFYGLFIFLAMERCSSKMECYRVPWSEENQHSCNRNLDSRPTTIQFVSSLIRPYSAVFSNFFSIIILWTTLGDGENLNHHEGLVIQCRFLCSLFDISVV